LKIPVGANHCRFDEEPLQAVLKSVIKDKLGDENAAMANDEDRDGKFCPVFVVATEGQNADGPAKLFRSYGFYRDQCPIWQAARATSAAPTYFKPAFVDTPAPGGWYIDGGLKRNNPSYVALEEARNYWETTKHFCVVSIGTGQQRTVNFIGDSTEEPFADSPSFLDKVTEAAANTISKIPGASTIQKIANIGPGILTLKAFAEELVRLSTSADDAHEEMLKLANPRHLEHQFPYHRFNVHKGMDRIGLEEWKEIHKLGALTRGYLEEKETQLAMARCVRNLVQPPEVERM